MWIWFMSANELLLILLSLMQIFGIFLISVAENTTY